MKYEIRIGDRQEDYMLWIWPENEEEKIVLHLLASRNPMARVRYDGHSSYKKVSSLRIHFCEQEETTAG